jgi:DNA adenine methylase
MRISNQIKAFTYLGAKYSLLPWLKPFLEVGAKHFVDVFGGSAAVLLNLERHPIETYNDLNDDVVMFFHTLRTQRDELIKMLKQTPYSRSEYVNAWFSENDSSVERARKFFVRTQQSLWAAGAHDKKKGWAISVNESRNGMSEKVNKWNNAVSMLEFVSDRLLNVQIDNRDFRFILKSYDSPNTLFYCDPPYDSTFRSGTKYSIEFSNQDFYDLAYWSKNVVGKIAISGYGSDFMKETFSHLNFYQGPIRKNSRSEKQAFECLWTNYIPKIIE